MILEAKLRCLEVNILRVFKVVKSLSSKGLGWLGFGLVERFVKEQSYEGSIWYHVCFNNESNNEIIKINWTRCQKSIEFKFYIHVFSSQVDLIDIDRNLLLLSIIVDRSTSIDNQDNVDRRRPLFPLFSLISWQTRNIKNELDETIKWCERFFIWIFIKISSNITIFIIIHRVKTLMNRVKSTSSRWTINIVFIKKYFKKLNEGKLFYMLN